MVDDKLAADYVIFFIKNFKPDVPVGVGTLHYFCVVLLSL
jgi:hypothetical protein